MAYTFKNIKVWQKAHEKDYERLSVLADEVGKMLFGFQKTLKA